MTDFQILRAEPSQAGALTRIAFAAKRHWRYPEGWIELWAPALTILPGFVGENEVWVAMAGEQEIAFYALSGEGAEASLEHLWVLPERMGRGVGARLFSHAVSRSRERGFSLLLIESDPNAQGFYERMGARKVRENVYCLEGATRALPVLEMTL
jgi:ribosomal protein S18 acetylase RimI-like enzyme